MVDVVYIVRNGEANEELRYSLRSLQNIPHGKVYIIGYVPSWLKNVVPIRLNNGDVKYRNAWNNLYEAAVNPNISDDFIFMNDDIFILKPMDSIPILHRGPLQDMLDYYSKFREKHYFTQLADTQKYMQSIGLKDLISYELHVPFVFNKEKLKTVMDLLKTQHLTNKRTFYGNYWHIGGDKTKDMKISSRSDEIFKANFKDWPFISTSDTSFTGAPGRYIRGQFIGKSQYEV